MRPLLRLATVLSFPAVALFASSCSRILDFDVTESIPSTEIQGSPIAAVLSNAPILGFPITINLQEETQAHGTGPAQSVTLSSLTLTLTSPSGQTWDFLDSITVSVAPQSGSSPPEMEIAHLSPVPKGQTTISLQPDPGVNLVPYINAGAVIDASATGHAPSQNLMFDGQAVFHVHPL